MFALSKLLLLCYFIVIGVTICASRNIDNRTDSRPRIFFYFKEYLEVFSNYVFCKDPFIEDTKVLKSNQSSILSIEYDAEENTLFCTTTNGELLSIIWNKDGNTQDSFVVDLWPLERKTLLYSEKDWYPISMALDDVGKKLYIADTSERSIDVFDLNGQYKTRIFVSDCVIPLEIAVDSDEGLLFLYGVNFLKRKTELHRMNMDGSDYRLIIDTIENLAEVTLRVKANVIIDRENKRLFYKASSNNIATADYNGHGGRLILSNRNVEYFGIDRNFLVWTERSERKDAFKDGKYHYIQVDGMIDENKSLYWTYPLKHCYNQIRNISSFSCELILESHFWTKDPRMNALKVIDYIPRKKLANPCLASNNECEDHCLLKSSGLVKKLSFSCACRLGRKINNDEKTCSDIKEQKIYDESIPYVYEKVLFLYKPRTKYSTPDAADEFSIHKISSNFAKKFLHDEFQLVWDDTLGDIYRVDEIDSLVKYQNEKSHRILRSFSEDIYASRVLAYDWVSKNLYCATSLANSDQKYNLSVIATRYPEKEILLGQIDSPTSMAVHPYRGYIFIATYDESKKESHIIRLNTDGKDKLMLPYSNDTEIMLTLDMAEDKIYWSDGSYKKKDQRIWSSNLDGSDTKLLISSNFGKNITISVYGENIYLKEHKSLKGQFYVFTKSGEEIVDFSLYALEPAVNNVILTKQKVKKTDTQYLSEKNPCVQYNGGCEIFCFATPTNNSQTLQKVCSE